MNKRTEEIFEIIRACPGSSGAVIYEVLLRRSRAARWFGPDSALAILFGPSLSGAIYLHLARLERERRIRSEWVPGPFPRRRVYFAEPPL